MNMHSKDSQENSVSFAKKVDGDKVFYCYKLE